MTKKLGAMILVCTMAFSCAQADRTANINTTAGGPKQTSTSSSRETGRSFLPKGKNETAGYGLYSYLLFGAPPTPATRERYVQAITAFLSIPTIAELEHYLPTCELNVTYMPTTAPPPTSDPDADWVLANYDYARARVFLQTLGGKHRDGPYIISTYKPLSGVQRLSGQYLYQDLSSTPPRIISLWVTEFLNQVEQERFWEERSVMQCVLKLRQGIEIAAEGLPDVQKSLTTVIAWVK